MASYLEGSDLILLIIAADYSAHITLERLLAAVGQRLDRQSAESLLRPRARIHMTTRS